MNDKDVMSYAVKCHDSALYFASAELQNDIPYVYSLLKKHNNLGTDHNWLKDVLCDYKKMGGYMPINRMGLKKGLPVEVTKCVCDYL